MSVLHSVTMARVLSGFGVGVLVGLTGVGVAVTMNFGPAVLMNSGPPPAV